MTTSGLQTDTEFLTNLVQKCTQLCTNAQKSIEALDEHDAAFLAHNLEGALQQVELILRVMGQGQEDSSRDSDRQGFLRRLFARDSSADKDSEPKPAMPPSFDVSKQGLFGNSWTVGLAELLGFLAFGNKTGVLWVDSQSENFIVQLIDGKLVHATSDHTPEGLRLGEILVGLGYLTRRQLERFLTRNEGQAVSGEELLENGMISDDELEEALQHQVKQLFLRLVQTDNAVFRFSEGMQIELVHTVDLDVNRLLLDSAKDLDEAGSSTQRTANVLQEWNAWQQSLAQTAATSLARQADEAAAKKAAPTSSTTSPTEASTPETSITDDTTSKATTSKDKPSKTTTTGETETTTEAPSSVSSEKSSGDAGKKEPVASGASTKGKSKAKSK